MANYGYIGDGFFIGLQPTVKELQEEKQQSINTTIDFRKTSETAKPNEELVEKSGFDYVNVPVNKAF